jgi:hypothetical protein
MTTTVPSRLPRRTSSSCATRDNRRFRGPLAEIGAWDTAEAWPGQYRLDAAEPAFVWPADHAWCVARDVDPHWAGIGGDTPLVDQLVADPLLDVASADPAAEQPSYHL